MTVFFKKCDLWTSQLLNSAVLAALTVSKEVNQ